MPEPRDCEALLVQHLPFIERMAAKYGRGGGLSEEETADFTSWATQRLIENDYAKIRKFRGESAFSTYVATVLYTLYQDFRVSRQGRWRPSAEAKRLGSVAIALERLVYRDGNSFDQAVSILLSRGVGATEEDLRKLFKKLPPGNRGRPKNVGDAGLGDVAAPGAADRDLANAEAEAERERTHHAVHAALAKLSPEDRHIVHLRYFEGASVADIARALRLEQKPLYRRLDRLLLRLREELEGSGISQSDVKDMLAEDEK